MMIVSGISSVKPNEVPINPTNRSHLTMGPEKSGTLLLRYAFPPNLESTDEKGQRPYNIQYYFIDCLERVTFHRCKIPCVCYVCFLPIHSGHQVRWTYQPGSHRSMYSIHIKICISYYTHLIDHCNTLHRMFHRELACLVR